MTVVFVLSMLLLLSSSATTMIAASSAFSPSQLVTGVRQRRGGGRYQQDTIRRETSRIIQTTRGGSEEEEEEEDLYDEEENPVISSSGSSFEDDDEEDILLDQQLEQSEPPPPPQRSPPPPPPPQPSPPQQPQTSSSVATSSVSTTTTSMATTTSSASLLGPNASPPGWLRQKFPLFPWHRVPNTLTYLRCAAIPLLVLLFCLPGRHFETGWVFGLASFTDWLDGYLARKWDITSAFGAFLDPVADKLMVSTALVLLSGRHGAVVAVPAAIILARELAVSALREWMAQRGQRDVVKVGIQGKIKTALTMAALTLLLFVPENGSASTTAALASLLYQPGLLALYGCAVITVTSGSVYFRAAAPVLFSQTTSK